MATQISPILLNDFVKLFSGNPNKYGSHRYDEKEEVVEGKKEEGRWSGWVKDEYKNFIPPTNQTFKEHLEGKEAMGVCPIDDDNNVRFSVLDVDVYSKEHSDSVVNFIYNSGMPIQCFRSKSGGLHLYVFFENPEPAKDVRKMMRKFLPLLDLPDKTELFPKQDRLRGEDSGNWINLPYFNVDSPRAYLYGDASREVPFPEALSRIKSKLQTLDSLKAFFESLEYGDAPPCLQALALRGGVTELRNIYLFNFATYLKSKFGKDEEFVSQVLDVNASLPEPLPTSEVMKSIIQSHKRKDYTYKCKEEPLCSHCNKNECKLREYGIGSSMVSILDYEELVQYVGDESAYYEWKVNGKILAFKDEADIINQEKFRQQCMCKLHILPNKLRQETWTGIINTALQNIKVEKIDEENDISPYAMLTVYLKEFLVGRKLATNRNQVLIGKVYLHEEEKVYYFKKEALTNFLESKKFTALSKADISRKIRNIGKGHAIQSTLYLGDRKTTRVMGIPADFITEEDKARIEDDQLKVDFSKYDPNPF